METLEAQLKVAKLDVFRARESMAIQVGRARSLAKAQRDEQKKELKALKDAGRQKFMFPRWVQYVVYALILAAIIILQNFVFYSICC